MWHVLYNRWDVEARLSPKRSFVCNCSHIHKVSCEQLHTSTELNLGCECLFCLSFLSPYTSCVLCKAAVTQILTCNPNLLPLQSPWSHSHSLLSQVGSQNPSRMSTVKHTSHNGCFIELFQSDRARDSLLSQPAMQLGEQPVELWRKPSAKKNGNVSIQKAMLLCMYLNCLSCTHTWLPRDLSLTSQSSMKK